jgi:hypothetical protein
MKGDIVRNHRSRLLILLTLLLPLPARAALTPVGSPRVIFEAPICSDRTSMEVVATPAGAFDVIWADDEDAKVLGQRFARNLAPTGSPATLMNLHGGQFIYDLVGAWAGRYELAINGLDFGDHPDNPATGYRVSMGLAGNPLGPPLIVRAGDFFVKLAPLAGGDSLLFRYEPPIFGTSCQNVGLLARRIDESGAALSPDSRVNRRASALSLGQSGQIMVERLPDDTSMIVYPTCEKFTGLVARRLNASGAPVGNPINLSLPAGLGNFGAVSSLALAARGAADFAVAATVADSRNPGINGTYTRAVVNKQAFGPTRLPIPASATFAIAVDLAVSPAGNYLLLFQGPKVGETGRSLLFAQELDARGVPQGGPVQIAEADNRTPGLTAAVASLPGGRWAVATQEQNGEGPDCRERVVVTVLDSH